MLVIPPGWEVVKRYKDPTSRIQVICKDSKGRSQYIYHPLWGALSSALKFKRLMKFSKQVRKLNKASTTDDIDNLIKLMMTTNIRVGSDKYAEDNETFGVSTLLTKHVYKSDKRGELSLRFVGKSGHSHDVLLKPGPNVEFIKHKLREARSKGEKRLFPSGTAERLRVRFKELFGCDFTPKDIRTYKANTTLLLYLRRCSCTNLKKELLGAIERTASTLHHTTSVCKSNYLCPQILELWLKEPSLIKRGKGVNLYKLTKSLNL